MINQAEKPGYGYQINKGATSLTEAWDATSVNPVTECGKPLEQTSGVKLLLLRS